MDSRILCSFYRCTIERILTGCITAWYSSCTALNRKALQRVVKAAQHITRTELPSMEDLYTQRAVCRKKATKIIKDPSHPSHPSYKLFCLLPSGRRFRSIRARTTRLRDSFIPQAIRLFKLYTSSSHAMQAEENTSSLSCSVDKGDGGSTSMIVPVWISSTSTPEKETLVYALMDTQSSSTFVDQEVCEKMGAGLEPVKLKLTTMMGKDSIVQSERVSSLRVRGFSSQSFINLPPAYTRDFIPLERSHIPTTETARRWKHLNSIAKEIPELMDCEVGLLIGYDCSRALAPRQVITGGDDEPYAVKTDLGWSIVGSSPQVAKASEVTGLCHRVSVKELPSLTPATVIKALESDFKAIHQDSDGHLEMPLPFKTRPQLPENKRLALLRLNQLKRKFEKNPKFDDDYTKFMEGIFKDGDAEEAESQPKAGNVWYIPHQGVYHPRKPGKIRVVFDC
ncbi:hypothetical protein L3Q82_002719 [Scortum barcoo]|uniref:Uncharacterized protein n=1 Tax=Scortum barcoo TaxID=214431 RepID=A0ACB8VU19_9TELE|nr:hypothetical protein L3Q82_002719 [Scortum barcoo]